MSYALDYPIAAQASEDARVAFIRRTYGHVAVAILAFLGIEVALFQSGAAIPIAQALFSGGSIGMIILLVAFIGSGWVAQWWANSATSVAMQYAGLGLYVVVESIIFLPLLIAAQYFSHDPNIIPQAAILTLAVFGGLTAAVFTTKRDYSFLGPILSIGMFLALGLAVAGMFIGFSLGLVYSFFVVALASGYIIYDTSNVLHHYRTDQHVAAALQLFADVALLFYYILRIFLASRND